LGIKNCEGVGKRDALDKLPDYVLAARPGPAAWRLWIDCAKSRQQAEMERARFVREAFYPHFHGLFAGQESLPTCSRRLGGGV